MDFGDVISPADEARNEAPHPSRVFRANPGVSPASLGTVADCLFLLRDHPDLRSSFSVGLASSFATSPMIFAKDRRGDRSSPDRRSRFVDHDEAEPAGESYGANPTKEAM